MSFESHESHELDMLSLSYFETVRQHHFLEKKINKFIIRILLEATGGVRYMRW